MVPCGITAEVCSHGVRPLFAGVTSPFVTTRMMTKKATTLLIIALPCMVVQNLRLYELKLSML